MGSSHSSDRKKKGNSPILPSTVSKPVAVDPLINSHPARICHFSLFAFQEYSGSPKLPTELIRHIISLLAALIKPVVFYKHEPVFGDRDGDYSGMSTDWIVQLFADSTFRYSEYFIDTMGDRTNKFASGTYIKEPGKYILKGTYFESVSRFSSEEKKEAPIYHEFAEEVEIPKDTSVLEGWRYKSSRCFPQEKDESISFSETS